MNDSASVVALHDAGVAATVPTRSTAHATPAPRDSMLRHALVLGTLTAMGAFGIDTYLPAFAAIAKSLHVTEGAVQLSLVSYFIALAVGQSIYGPFSDRHGRRGALILGFGLFVLASIGCAMAPSIEWIIALRFVQGIGACAGMVLTRAIVRDLRSGEEAARLFALMLLVLSVSPIFAPMIGSLLLAYLPWQSVFWFMGSFAALCLIMIFTCLEETNPPERRSGGIGEAFRNYGTLVRDRHFMTTVLIGGFSQAALFAYLAGSPFVYLTLNHVSPTMYSVLFAVTAMALIGTAQFNVHLIRRVGAPRLVLIGSIVQCSGAVALFIATLLHHDSVAVIAPLLLITMGCQGVLGPTTAVLALEPYAASAGAASALMGTLQFAAGALSSSLVSVFFDNTSRPFGGVIAGCALAGLVLAILMQKTPAAEATASPVAAGH